MLIQSFAQAPQKMSFQAVMRNANNELISKSNIGIQISILQGATNGIVVYTESQNVISDFNGLISLQIGTGNVSFGTFSNIDWANGPYFIKTEADPTGGKDYSIVGSTELLSVPYAMFALNADVNDFLGSSYDKIDLSKLILGQNITINITKGLNFGTIGHIIVSDAIKNHFEGLVMSYDKTKGLLVLNITEIVGSVNNNFWTIKIDGSRGYNGLPGINGTNGTNGLIGLTGNIGLDGAIGLKGDSGAIGKSGINGTNGINGVDGAIGLKGDSGAIGKSGINGTNGINGVDGAIGLKGDSGTIGKSGINGTNGINGVNIISDTAISLKGLLTSITTLNSLSGVNTGDQILPTLNSLGAEPVIASGASSEYYRGDKTWQTLNSTVVGLSNVDNTTDMNKPVSTATSAYVLANADRYNSISAGNEIFTTSTTDVLATGMSFTPTAGKYIVNFNSEYTIVPGDRTGQAQTDLNAAYLNLMSRTVTNSTHAAGYGAGETLSPGVYYNGGAVTTTGTLTLDAGGNPNAEFVFQIGAAFSTGAGFTIILANGASACNVYFIAEGAIALGANTVMKGMLISNSGAVSLGSLSNVQGNLFSSAGSIGLDASTVNTLTGCTNNFGTLSNFAIFSKSGIISNAGASSITGNIASNTGTVSGFESATLNGSIYASGASNATATFSVYQNGELIPFSSRKRKSTINLGEINLQALATISSGGSIEVRWNIDLGTVKMQNRILTVQQVR